MIVCCHVCTGNGLRPDGAGKLAPSLAQLTALTSLNLFGTSCVAISDCACALSLHWHAYDEFLQNFVRLLNPEE